MSRVAVPASGLRTVLMATALVLATAGAASAQNASCVDIQKTLLERKSLVEQLGQRTKGGKKLTPQDACGLFTKLTTNGSTGLKWIEANKEWCSVPDQFAESFKADHEKIAAVRGKACAAAAQQAAMEKKMRAQAQNGSAGGLLGGPGLTGTQKMPQGAL